MRDDLLTVHEFILGFMLELKLPHHYLFVSLLFTIVYVASFVTVISNYFCIRS